MREDFHVRAYRGDVGGEVEMLVFQKILSAWKMNDPLCFGKHLLLKSKSTLRMFRKHSQKPL